LVGVVAGEFRSCTTSPLANSIPVVNGRVVVVWAGTHSGPVTVESVCVSVPVLVAVIAGVAAVDLGAAPGSVADVVMDVVVGDVDVVGVVVVTVGVPVDVTDVGDWGAVMVATPPARFTPPPHTAAVPVFVTITSVTTSTTPSGTMNASTAAVPDGTARVISTTFCTVASAVGAGAAVVVGVVVDGVVIVCALSWFAATTPPARSTDKTMASETFMDAPFS
jgi:hypothetical protein